VRGISWIPPRFDSPQPGDIRHDYADIEKAKRLLSYQPTWDIHRGLGETVKWYIRAEANKLLNTDTE
jgi:nucleoside-diphosphate-sugar epimerase